MEEVEVILATSLGKSIFYWIIILSLTPLILLLIDDIFGGN